MLAAREVLTEQEKRPGNHAEVSLIIRPVGRQVVLRTDTSGSARYAGPFKRSCGSIDNPKMTALSVDMP